MAISNPFRRKPIRATEVAVETQTEPAKTHEVKRGFAFYVEYIAKDKPALLGTVIIGAFLVFALIEGALQEAAALLHQSPYNANLGTILLSSNPIALRFSEQLLPPSFKNFPDLLLGSNFQGQSLLSSILYATPHDAVASLLVVGSAIFIGMFVGTSAGYLGGWTDEVMMRLTDAFLALPAIVLAITISVLIGGGFTSLLVALTVIWWPTYARFFRAQALTIRNKGYVEASKLSGSGWLKILVRHIIPNSVDPIIAYATLDMGTVILTYATLAFLGIGVTSGYPEWGYLSSSGLQFFPQQWWYSVIPGVVIAVVVVAFTLAGDRLQDLIGGRITY
ncbi:MAG: ABC transporter permease [Thaumarchaeota archaeon]|nr:ABC transporter permease [Nitrososphaerota archaeon]